MGQDDQGTGVPEETEMALDQQDGLGAEAEAQTRAVQEPPIGLPPLERRRQLDLVSTVAQLTMIAQALGRHPSRRVDPQAGQKESSQRTDPQTDQPEIDEQQGSQQAGSGQLAPQVEPEPRSDSQDFIPLSFAQAQSGEEPETGEIPLSREQMRRAGMLLQESVAQEQRTASA